MPERELIGSVDSQWAMLVPDEVNGLWFRDGGSPFQTSTPASARGGPLGAVLTLRLNLGGTGEISQRVH
jgi:hypothetical protein